MALRSGLAAQLGIAQETTWGTYQVPDHFYELVSETIKFNKTRTMAKGIRPNKTVLRSQRFRTTKTDATGDLNLEVNSQSFGLLFKNMLGTSTPAADGAGYKRSYTLGDLYGLGLTIQVGTVAIDGTVFVRSYTGCKIMDWTLNMEMDSVLDLKLMVDSLNEDTTQSLATASYPASTYNEIFYVDQCAMTIGGVTLLVRDITLSGKNNQKVDRWFVGNRQKLQPVQNAYVDLGGSLTCDFNNLNIYNYFVNDDTASGNIVITATGTKSYDTGKLNKIVITLPSIRYDGDTPNISGPDVVQQTLNYAVVDNDANAPITIDYYTHDATD